VPQSLIAEPQSGPIQPARLEEIPPWIAELKPVQDQSAGTAQEPEAEVRMEELDEWLRFPSLESGASVAADESVETGGPLVKLRGVLPLAKQ